MTGPTSTTNKPPAKKSNKKYLINLAIIFLVAVGFTGFTLLTDNNFTAVVNAFSQANVGMILIILGVMGVVILIEATILFILARLYTTRYDLKRGINNYFIGIFFSHITPSGTGGQFAQAYVFKKQGIDIANGASILVMHFLLYQIAQVAFGILALIFRFNRFLSITQTVDIGSVQIPIIYLSLVGFVINFLIIFGILLLAKSKFIHTHIINGIVGLLGKMKVIKQPDLVKANLQIQIENFRIESKRLRSNTPVTIVLLVLFFLRMTLSNSIPYLSAMALPTIDLSQTNILDGVFMTAYLNVIIYFAPLPGAVGFSEFFFSYLFQSIFGGYSSTIAPQLIWRGVTFYLTLILGAFSLIAFRIGNKEAFFQADTQSFVDIQKSTIEMRRQTAEIMFNTGEMSTVNIRHRFSKFAKDFFGFKRRNVDRYGKVIHTDELKKPLPKDKKKDS
jgi:glycosyltransferase 2 family protein